MFILAVATNRTLKRMGRALGISRQAVAKRLETLQDKGWIRADAQESKVTYYVTKDGAQMLQRVMPDIPQLAGIDFKKPIAIKFRDNRDIVDPKLVARLHGEGKSPQEIAKRVNRSAKHVQRILKNEGMLPQEQFTMEQVEEAFRGGGTIEEIGKRLGLSISPTSELLDRVGLRKIRRMPRQIPEDEVRKAHAMSYSLNGMAKILSCSTSTASHYIEEYGLDGFEKHSRPPRRHNEIRKTTAQLLSARQAILRDMSEMKRRGNLGEAQVLAERLSYVETDIREGLMALQRRQVQPKDFTGAARP